MPVLSFWWFMNGSTLATPPSCTSSCSIPVWSSGGYVRNARSRTPRVWSETETVSAHARVAHARVCFHCWSVRGVSDYDTLQHQHPWMMLRMVNKRKHRRGLFSVGCSYPGRPARVNQGGVIRKPEWRRLLGHLCKWPPRRTPTNIATYASAQI